MSRFLIFNNVLATICDIYVTIILSCIVLESGGIITPLHGVTHSALFLWLSVAWFIMKFVVYEINLWRWRE